MMDHVNDENNIRDNSHHCDDEIKIELTEFRLLHALNKKCKSIRHAVPKLTVVNVTVDTMTAIRSGMLMLKNKYCANLVSDFTPYLSGATAHDNGHDRGQNRYRCSNGMEDGILELHVPRRQSEHQLAHRLCA